MLLYVLPHCRYFPAALQGTPLSATLSLVMSQCCRKIKDTVQKLASDHKDIHSSVSRVGKAIDRVSLRASLGWGWGCPGASVSGSVGGGKVSVSSMDAESRSPVSCPRQNFDSEICGVVSDAVWDSREKQQQILQMAIVEHLYQQGMLSVAEELCQVTAWPGRCWHLPVLLPLDSCLYVRFLLLFTEVRFRKEIISPA